MSLVSESRQPPSHAADAADLRGAYRKDIDGLRAIAVFSVVLFHAGVLAVRGGFVGVDVFFVISGYLIGAHVYREVVEGRFSLARFYQRRAKRILPALFVVLLFVYTAGVVLLSPLELTRMAKFAGTSVFSVSNVFAWLASSYFDPRAIQDPLLMTWSLGVEEHFYVFFPLLMLFFAWFARRGARQRERMPQLLMVVMALVVFVTLPLCVWETQHDSGAAFNLLPFRAWELAVGVLMAIYEAQPRQKFYGGDGWWAELRGAAGVVAILGAVFLYNAGTVFPGPGAVLPVVGAAFVLSAPAAWVNRVLLSWGPMRWIGLVSYSWYLWHWPLLSLVTVIAGETLPLRIALPTVVVALGVAWLSYRYIEGPFRRSRMAAAPLLRRYGVACVLMAMPAVPMVLTHGLPRRFPVVATQDAMLAAQKRPCISWGLPTDTQECLPKPDGRDAVAIFGDSHASVLAPQLTQMAEAAGMRTLTLSHVSCPPLLGAVRHNVTPGYDATCVAFNQKALAMLTHDATVKTVFLAGLWDGPFALDPPEDRGYLPLDAHGNVTQPNVTEAESEAELGRGLGAMVEALHAAGKRVVLLQDVESFRFDPQVRMRSALIPVRGWLATRLTGEQPTLADVTDREMYAPQNLLAARVVAQVGAREGVEVFDLRSKLCGVASCRYFADGVLLYGDPNHVTTAGARRVLSGLRIR